MKKKIFIIALAAMLVAGVVAYLTYNKPHRDIGKATSDFTVEANALFREFEEDETTANAKYLDKVVKVSGSLKAAETDDEGNVVLTLESGDELFGVVCNVPKENLTSEVNYAPGEEVTVKGVCTGKLMDVVLMRCVVEE